jgi:hypothetical protein
MLEDYYVKPSTIDRVRGSWLAPQIESYLEWLEAHGYSRLVVYRRLPLLFHFAEFAEKKGCRDIAFCKAYIKEFVSRWLEQHGAKAKTVVAVSKHAIDAECGVRQMLQLACNEPVIRNRRRRPFPFESIPFLTAPFRVCPPRSVVITGDERAFDIPVGFSERLHGFLDKVISN